MKRRDDPPLVCGLTETIDSLRTITYLLSPFKSPWDRKGVAERGERRKGKGEKGNKPACNPGPLAANRSPNGHLSPVSSRRRHPSVVRAGVSQHTAAWGSDKLNLRGKENPT